MIHRVRHAITGEVISTHKTKKAATAEAKEATAAHEAIGALHNGLPVAFKVESIDDAPPAIEGAD